MQFEAAFDREITIWALEAPNLEVLAAGGAFGEFFLHSMQKLRRSTDGIKFEIKNINLKIAKINN
jgi:hypothetical protein